jgi:poly(3-hydroxybutyrate) depolymerase
VITHGTADPVVPFSETDVGPHTLFLIRELVLGTGGNDAQRRMITAITATSVTSWAESWANRNGCRPDAPEVASPAPGVHVTTYRDCQAGGDVVLQVIEGGGHDWPTSPGFDAIAEVLEFFWSHPLPVEALR